MASLSAYLAANPALRLTDKLFAILLFVIGLVIAAGGVVLVAKGGSPYYVLGGAAVLGSAVLYWRGDSRAAFLYAGFLAVTILWSLYESGLDGWRLAPRLIGPALFGFWFATPAARRVLPAVIGRRIAVAASAAAWGVVLLGALAPASPAGPLPEPVAGEMTSAQFVAPGSGEWPVYGGTLAGTRFSPLDQINAANVGRLQVAWSYRTGVVQKGAKSGLQVTPLMVDDTLYLCTQTNIVIALDPETGAERWRFDPQVDPKGASIVTTCRGVAFARVAAAADCPTRIITATFDARLIALDAKTGKPCASFGQGGFVDLKADMGPFDAGLYYVSSAPTIVRNRIVLGGWVADNVSVGEPSGVIRAFDVVTGAFIWAWDAGRPGARGLPEPGTTYTRGTPNSWAPMSGDEALGLVYIPTGNATPDHWGGHRKDEWEKYSSAVVALDAETGEPRWAFQTVHHDLWDYDVASQATLIDLKIGQERVPALLQATKQGEVFLLDRRTGAPLSPVEEQPAPQGAAEGDHVSPTQPVSTGLPSLVGPPLRERDMWGLTPIDQLWCRIFFRSLRYDGRFTPPNTKEALIYPGIGGGMNWGGLSLDPERGVMIAEFLNIGTTIRLVPRAEAIKPTGEGYHDLSGAAPQQQAGTPFAAAARTFLSPLNVPCNAPPYGVISAIDMNTRTLLWSRRLGTARDSGPLGMNMGLPFTLGSPFFGGAVVTRSGLIFIAATRERAIRALDLHDGRILWSARLPPGGQSTPMTYRSPKSGRQFLVVSAGGHGTLQTPIGDHVIAFALPGP